MSIKEEQINILDLTIDVIKKDIKNMHLSVYPPTGRVRIAAPKDLNDEAFRNIGLGENYFRILGLNYKSPPVCNELSDR